MAGTEDLLSTSGWRELEADFATGPQTRLIAIKVMRVAGNPLIMKEMVKHVVDAGSYAPVTILIEERPDSVRISYDRMASYLAPYGNSDALKVARELDAKVERILTAAAK